MTRRNNGYLKEIKMSSIQKLKYTRWVKQGKSEHMTITSMSAMTSLAYNRMSFAPWKKVAEQVSTLPIHHWTQSGFKDSYDAAKFCGDYDKAMQVAYACAACYSIKMPADALDETDPQVKAQVEAVLASVYGDRWLSEGAIVSVFLTDSSTPPDWGTITDKISPSYIASSPDPAPSKDDVSEWEEPLRELDRSNIRPDRRYDATLTPLAPVDATQYLHIVIRLSDYVRVSKIEIAATSELKDNAWIEGGAAIDGTTLQIQFDREVAEDISDYVLFFPKEWQRTEYRPLTSNNYDVDIGVKIHHPAYAITGNRHYRALLEQREWPIETFQTYSTQFEGVGLYEVEANLITTTNNQDSIGFFTEAQNDNNRGKYGTSAVLFGRSAETKKESVVSISFDADIPTPPSGVVFKLAVFCGLSGYFIDHKMNIEASNEGVRKGASQMIASVSMINRDLWNGNKDTDIFFIGSSETAIEYQKKHTIKNEYVLPSIEAYGPFPITLLASKSLTQGVPANTKIPLLAPFKLPKFAMIYAALSVESITKDYDTDREISDLKRWWPKDFKLHLEE